MRDFLRQRNRNARKCADNPRQFCCRQGILISSECISSGVVVPGSLIFSVTKP